jgi:hypothetical protein
LLAERNLVVSHPFTLSGASIIVNTEVWINPRAALLVGYLCGIQGVL